MEVLRFISYLLILGVLSALTKLTLSEEIKIYPSCSGRGSTCRTLASLSFSSRNAVLTFMPGNHQISNSKFFEDMTYLEFRGSGVDVSNITCTHYSYSATMIKISYAARAMISGLTIVSCNVVFVSTTEVSIQNSDFLSLRDGLDLWTINNVTIDQCKFNRYNWFSGTIMHFYNVNSFRLTRSKLYNVNRGSHSCAVFSENSFGYFGCLSMSHINSGAAICLTRGSSMYVTNSTFTDSTSGSIIELQSARDHIAIVSSIFQNCRSHGSKGAIFYAQTSASISVLACQFSEIRGLVIRPSDGGATVDCNSPLHWLSAHNNLKLCKRHTPGVTATCNNSLCSQTDCAPPSLEISLDESEYVVSEGMGRSHRALQICAEARDILFPVMANITVQNGSAIENRDFNLAVPQCQSMRFKRKNGIQKECVFIRIYEDSGNENDKQFSVRLALQKPYVVSGISRATVTIQNSVSTAIVSTPVTTVVTAETPFENLNSSFRMSVVECGPLRRMVNYSVEGNHIENLKDSIVQSFGQLTGLKSRHIALLQVKADQHGDFMDVLSGYPAILHNSFIKVIPYEGFECVPKINGADPTKQK